MKLRQRTSLSPGVRVVRQSFALARRRSALILAVSTIAAIASWSSAAVHFRLSPIGLGSQLVRVVATPVLARWYEDDLDDSATQRRAYWHSGSDQRAIPEIAVSGNSWPGLDTREVNFSFIDYGPPLRGLHDLPFVYESPDAPHLEDLRTRYDIAYVIADAQDEYDAMLKLGAWVGTRWDHGVDPVPGGSQVHQVADVIAAGEAGSKFSCEIASRTLVHTATALGWPARLVTASRDGYTWEHAVAELWSNQFEKWFLIDADFNLVYEAEGVPLSAFELSHEGPRLQDANKLLVRPIAAAKPSLPPQDLMAFYAYIHVDLRNDWSSRRLPRGSPAGGDLATWWTVRPTFGPVLAAKRRNDD